MENFRTLPTIIYFNPNESLQISKAELLSDDFSLAIDILNMGNDLVNKISLAVKFKDFNGQYLFNESEFYFSSNVEILPHSKYYMEPFSLDERFSSARSIDIRISAYNTDKGPKKINATDETPLNLPLIPEKKLEKIKETLGPEINTYGENLLNYWRCVCGAVNTKDTEECRFCKRNKNFVLNNLTEPLINSKIVSVLLNTTDKSLIEIESLERNITRAHVTKVAPTKESITKNRINDLSLTYKKTIKKTGRFFSVILKIFLVLLLIIFLFSFARKVYEKNRLAKAETLIADGKYEDAHSIYLTINTIDPNLDLKKEFDKTEDLLKSEEKFKIANQKILEENYIAAVKYLNEVIPQDKKNFAKAGEKVEELEDIILKQVVSYYENGNKSKALQTVKNYLEVEPQSVRVEMLLKDINSAKDVIKIPKGTSDYYEDITKNDDVANMKELSNSLLNTYQKVTTKKANLRSQADVNSDVVTVLAQGSELYIEKTRIEGSVRVWCYVQAKDIESGQIFKGWISNKVIMP